jgi:hypothetical protein
MRNKIAKVVNRQAMQRARTRPHKRREPWASGPKALLLDALEEQAFESIARGRLANVELGRVFLQIKRIVGRGRWERYYKERFGSCGVASRTARSYMEMAKKEDADAIPQTADSAEWAGFPMAADGQAQEMRAATAMAQAEVDQRQKGKVRLDRIFKLPLSLTIDEQEATRELVKSPDWSHAQQEIIALLKQLHVKCGIVNSGAYALGGEDRDDERRLI